jgi:hypothetical protein
MADRHQQPPQCDNESNRHFDLTFLAVVGLQLTQLQVECWPCNQEELPEVIRVPDLSLSAACPLERTLLHV